MNPKYVEQQLDILFPSVGCELIYDGNPFYLLIAVMLSAQTTDKKVNQVTKELFKRYETIDELSKASVEEVERYLKILGLSKVKAKRVIEIARLIKDKYNYEVPKEKEELITLPGVGVKTANVIRVEYFKIPEFPVDTHVYRVSKRLGLVDSAASIEETEGELRKIFDEQSWGKLHHQFIHFGRYICKAISPLCDKCPFKCNSKNIK